ncbi:hypothetical protein [Pararobbsia alpina]|uniref:Secreted protein n=1 Tax=Pararobbsia alpina TaxID=621374 RepID=A0A6S7BMZ9_9BURK|nr:hypothetical protein [Pararobbsia alpina]CAB3805987.1 hypothetical protein LMG28138_05743 [Pararobbsia alpina]
MSSKSIFRIARLHELKRYARAGSNLARAAAISLVVVATACAAQTAPAPTPGNLPAPPPVAAPMGNVPNMALQAPPPAPAPFMEQQQSRVATGTIRRFVINPEGDVDGFVFADDTLVLFPPHMSSQLVSLVHRGDTVRIVGLRDNSGNVSAQQITNERTGQQLVDQPPPVDVAHASPVLRGAGLVQLSVKGIVMRVTTAPRGEPDGVMLQDGTIVKMPPPVARQYMSLLRPAVVIAARGYGTRNQYGEALEATAFGTPDNVTQLYNNNPN